MSIVLSDIDLDDRQFPADVEIIKIEKNSLLNYNGNCEVAIIVGSRDIAIETIKLNYPGLRLIQLTSAGFDGVPIDIYKERGVAVANAGSVYSSPIAETVVFSILFMAKKLHKNPNNRHIKLQRHYDETITEIAGKNIIILGTGNIGTAIARRLQGFEANIDGYNRSKSIKPEYRRVFSGKQDLIEHIGEYDYIISTLPDSEETRGLIDNELIKKMFSNAVLINVGRRAVINENDLYKALQEQRISGAVLDMFEKLPNPVTNKFRRLSNVVVLPGVSAVSKEVKERLRKHISLNIMAVINGDTITSVINGVR